MSALYLPEPSDPPDPDFRETIEGGHVLIVECIPGHALVVEYGDSEFYIHCECQQTFAHALQFNSPWGPAFLRWQEHRADAAVRAEVHCQCGRALGFLPAGFAGYGDYFIEEVASAWARHSMWEIGRTSATELDGGAR